MELLRIALGTFAIVAATIAALIIGQPIMQWLIDHAPEPVKRFAAFMGFDQDPNKRGK